MFHDERIQSAPTSVYLGETRKRFTKSTISSFRIFLSCRGFVTGPFILLLFLIKAPTWIPGVVFLGAVYLSMLDKDLAVSSLNETILILFTIAGLPDIWPALLKGFILFEGAVLLIQGSFLFVTTEDWFDGLIEGVELTPNGWGQMKFFLEFLGIIFLCFSSDFGNHVLVLAFLCAFVSAEKKIIELVRSNANLMIPD